MINVFQPQLGDEELQAVKAVFDSNWIGKGKKTEAFERQFSEYLGVTQKLICSTNSCTEGLFSSMELLGITGGDEVIVPTISFVGAANSVCYHGLKLVLCDVDKKSLNVRMEDIERKITKKTRAVMFIHYGGVPCEMDDIMNLASRYNIKVIEDSACSVSSRYKNKACGTIGDMGMWSFDAMKILVCGDGSCLYFNSEELAEKARKWLYFGLESKSGFSNSVDRKWWEYEISSFGHRAIMNDVTASIALVQLGKLPGFIEKRRAIHEMYNELLKDVSWIDLPPELPPHSRSSYYFYHIQLKNEMRDNLAAYLKENKIYTTFRYFPLHRVKFYGINESFKNADWAADHTLCLPIHQSLSLDDVQYIAEKIKEFKC
jgi:aminotransferase